MKRNRHDRVDPTDPPTRLVTHDRPKHRTELTSTVVLETLSRICDGTAILEDGAFVRDLVDEGQTSGTEDRKAVTGFIATSAAKGCDQTEQSAEQIAHAGVSAGVEGGCPGTVGALPTDWHASLARLCLRGRKSCAGRLPKPAKPDE